MTEGGAQQAIVVSAVTTAGVYFYRRLAEPAIPAKTGKKTSAAALAGAGPPPPLGRFIVGYGVAYFGIALAAAADPSFGGWMAILLMASVLMANGLALSADINQRLSSKG
jgi:hypothetical protein